MTVPHSTPRSFHLPSPPPLLSRAGVLLVGVTGGIGSGKSHLCARIEAAGHPVFYCDDEAKRIIRTSSSAKKALRSVVGEEVYDTEGRLVKQVLASYLCQGRGNAARVDAVVHPRVAEAFIARARQMADALPTGAHLAAQRTLGYQAPLVPGKMLSRVASSIYAPTDAPADFPASFLRRYPRRDGTPDWAGVSPDNGEESFAPATTGQPVRTGLKEFLAACPPGRVLFMECALLFDSGFDTLVDRTLLVHASDETRLRRVMARDGISRAAAQAWMDLQMTEEERIRRADIVVDNEEDDTPTK